jgi:hypothetical protein
MSVQQYWNSVRSLREKLTVSNPEGVYLVTVPGQIFDLPGGVISLCKPEVAAIRLTDRTHELATKEQIEKYQAEQIRTGEVIRATSRFFTRLNGALNDTIRLGANDE